MLEIQGVGKVHAWGGRHFLPMLFGSCVGQECTEIWFSDSSKGCSRLVDGSLLSKWLLEDREVRLGKGVNGQTENQLPFILKVIDVAAPQSIHVHPGKPEAKYGYARSSSGGSSIRAGDYEDDRGRAEILHCLSNFYLFYGFTTEEKILANLTRYVELNHLIDIYKRLGKEGFLQFIFSMSDDSIKEVLHPLVVRYIPAYKDSELSKTEPIYWLLKSVMDGNTNDSPYDVGMLLVFLLELRYVKKGETIYLQPGVPHSYLSGRGLEVAENSNNTIRIGLSNKPSNKKEFSLLAKKEEVPLHCLTASITPRGSIEYSHQGFGLTLQEYNVERGSKVAAFESTSPSIWLLIEGEVRVGAQQHFCEAGCAFYQKPYEISSFEAQEDTRLFRVSVA